MTKSQILRTLLPLLFFVQVSYGQAGNVHWIGGKKFTSYKVQAKDTWTLLASKYSISMQELQKANDGVKDLKIGQTIYVPAEKGTGPAGSSSSTKPAATSTTKQAEATQSSNGNVYHTVQKGETLYRISKMYNQSIADIKKWNGLTSDNVPLGKSLIVSKGDAAKIEKPVSNSVTSPEISSQPVVKEEKPVVTEKPVEKPAEKPVAAEPAPSSTKDENKDGSFTEGTVEKVTETGVATWFNDQELNQNKFYALHRTAPIGTIIKVTNRMTNNSVFVKVVGVLPDTGDNANIIIKITQAAAQRIGAIDQKFTAELSYGITH